METADDLAARILAACETVQNRSGIFERCARKRCVGAVPAVLTVVATSSRFYQFVETTPLKYTHKV